ncbi:hypothetical protein VP01_1158g2 [Puccinia sorghi]|uniref:Uncharacterized protein n=1 Tax=Puccinia sorghi TaxID=27349 RepID=A0A0L6VRT9_9BASI|nr:hypothetical protein VP01_1158g2 [Puccinia sorghi]
MLGRQVPRLESGMFWGVRSLSRIYDILAAILGEAAGEVLPQKRSTGTHNSEKAALDHSSSVTLPSHVRCISRRRGQLLALHNSPLCVRPPALKPLSEWFGDYDFANPRTQPNHALPNPNLPPNHRLNQQSSPENSSQALAQSAASLPVLGRSQPPARNPFANFGKFGTEELPHNSLSSSLHLGGTNGPLNNSIKGGRRLMDRDCAPHTARTDNLNSDGSRRRQNNNSIGAGKERTPTANQITPEDQGSSDGKANNANNRRTLDRYVPDRDRDDSRLRNRERERERDAERDKTRRSSLNPRDATTGDDQMNWRRPPPGTTGGISVTNNTNKRSSSYQQTTNPPRANKDTPDSRDHSVREKERDKIINNKHPQSSNPANRSNNPQRAREKEKESGSSHTSHLPSSGSLAPASRETPPISPNAPATSHASRRVKDGAWDSGEGKWEISKPPNGRGANGYGTSETDAIQAWKAEMKALEAQKKLAAAASLDSQGDSSNHVQSPHQAEEREANNLPTTIDTHSLIHLQVSSKPDRNSQSNPSRQFDFTVIGASPTTDEHSGINSHPPFENDLAVLPRASRFAKFFDHHKDGGQQVGPASKNDSYSDKDSPTKAAGSPSVDPENMARVLSMLQMSSKTVEPPSDGIPASQSHTSSLPLLNKLLPSNGQPHHHNRDPMGFAHLHGGSSTSPPAAHAPGVRSVNEAELGDRTQAADDHNLNHLSLHNHPSSTPFSTFAGDSPRRSSPSHQIRSLEDLASHTATDHFGHFSAAQSSTSNTFAPSQNGPGNNPNGSQSIGSASNQPFSLFSTNHLPQIKSPVDASFGGLRNQAAHDPQMFQLRHMLHSVNSNSLSNIPAQQLVHDRSTDNQKLAFLSRQLHQQRMLPNLSLNQTSGANYLNPSTSLNPASPSSVSLQMSNNRQGMSQFEQSQQQQQQQQQNGLEYQRVPIAGPTSTVNGPSHGLQHLNPAPAPNAMLQLPSANAPYSALNNLLLHHQQPPAHHPGILPPAVNFAGSPTAVQNAVGNGRPGPAGFGHQAPQLIPGLPHHPMNQQQQLQQQLQQQQLQQFQRQQALPTGSFPNHPNPSFPFMGGPANRGFGGAAYGNASAGFGVVPMINNPPGTNILPQQAQTHPSINTNPNGLAGNIQQHFQHPLANLPPPQQQQQQQPTSVNGQTSSVHHSQLDLMSLLNAGNQRRIGM